MLLNQYYNFDSAAGIDYTVDLRNEDGKKVEISGFSDGRTFYADTLYNVAMNSYRGNGGGGHLEIGCNLSKEEINKRIVRSTVKDLRYYMLKWIENIDTLRIESDNNWKLIPEKVIDDMVEAEIVGLFNRE